MPKQRSYLKDLVAARIDELIPVGDNVGGQTAIEETYPRMDEELDLATLHILRIAPVHLLLQVAEYDKKHFHDEVDDDVIGTTYPDIDTPISIASNLIATVTLPDNFFRFVRVKLSGWERPVSELISIDSPKYRLQFNQFRTWNYTNPGVALIPYSGYAPGSYGTNERTKRNVSQTLTANQTLSSLFNGETPSGGSALSTNDVIILKGQTTYTENGIYRVNASGSPTKLSDYLTADYPMPGWALECFKAKTDSDTLQELFYIPRLKAEELPDEFADALVDETAYRVLRSMSRLDEAQIARQSSIELINSMKVGLQGEV